MSKLYFPVVYEKDGVVYIWGTVVTQSHVTLKQLLEKTGHTSIGIYRNGNCFYFPNESLDMTLDQLIRNEILVVKMDPA